MILHPGGCLCGAIRFEATGESDYAIYCHCFFCRRQTGAPVAAFAGFRTNSAFRWVKGKPSTYRSSAPVRRKFCKRCGTPLTFEADDRPELVYIGIGAFDDPDRLPMRAHVHYGHKISWFETTDALPRLNGSSVSISTKSPKSTREADE